MPGLWHLGFLVAGKGRVSQSDLFPLQEFSAKEEGSGCLLCIRLPIFAVKV